MYDLAGIVPLVGVLGGAVLLRRRMGWGVLKLKYKIMNK